MADSHQRRGLTVIRQHLKNAERSLERWDDHEFLRHMELAQDACFTVKKMSMAPDALVEELMNDLNEVYR